MPANKNRAQPDIDEDYVAEIESRAVDYAREAGRILTGHFGGALNVEYKDPGKRDPVTVADHESQAYVRDAVSRDFPRHGFVGEEDKASEGTLAPDFVWVVDPLDGTKNFISGLPVFACSIGVLHRGVPMVGAVYVPWPGDAGGTVVHARKGGGAFVEQEPAKVFGGDEPKGDRLVTLPGSFGGVFSFDKTARSRAVDVRITGSIAYEMVLTARGALEYSLILGPRIWDVAAGVTLVTEAAGVVLAGSVRKRRGLIPRSGLVWEPLQSFVPSWESGKTTLEELRKWSSPLVLGSPGIARYVTAHLRSKRRLRGRLSRAERPGTGA